MNTVTNIQPHEYFLHLFSGEFLGPLKAETNLLVGKIFLKGHLGSYSWLETYQS